MRLIFKPKQPSPPPDETPKPRDLTESLDSIIKRTAGTALRVSQRKLDDAQDRQAALEIAESKLAEDQHQLQLDKTEIAERERVLCETEMLLEARRRFLDEKEAIIAAHSSGVSPDKAIADLEAKLEESRDAFKEAQDTISKRQDEIDLLKQQIAQLEAAGTSKTVDTKQVPQSLDEITHPDLEEQVEFLRERELFIEQSENTLFEKAQFLQEWEIRLQQQEHDLDFANKKKESKG